MTANDMIRQAIDISRQVTGAYLGDLSDADLLVRPVPQANHTAWQLGHLIGALHEMVTALGHAMPELPAGFVDAHSPDGAKSDDPSRFVTKDEYLALLDKAWAAALAALDATSETDFEKPAPESMRAYAPTVAAAWVSAAMHELMHAGQWAVTRRKLGKPVVF